MSCFVFLPGCNPVKALCQSCKNVTHLISSHRLLQTNCFEEEVCFSVEFQNDLLFWWLINIFPLVSSHAKPHRKVVKNTIINIQVFLLQDLISFLGQYLLGFVCFSVFLYLFLLSGSGKIIFCISLPCSVHVGLWEWCSCFIFVSLEWMWNNSSIYHLRDLFSTVVSHILFLFQNNLRWAGESFGCKMKHMNSTILNGSYSSYYSYSKYSFRKSS